MADPHAPAVAHSAGAIPGTTIRFFLSSTFVDFQVERDVLQRRVFPELRRLCAEAGFRLQPIDLRWGVSEAAGTDRQTLRICFDELERCRRLSPDLFLLIQLGERYGSYILPPQVPASLGDLLLPHLTPDERAAFDAAYQLDENAVLAEYVLLRAEGPHDAEDEALRLALVRAGRAAGVAEADRLLFEGSATHREIQLGLLGQLPGIGHEAGVLCAVRTFTGDRVGPAASRFAAQDADRAATVQRVTDTVLARLPEHQVQVYEVAWDGERGPAFDEEVLADAYLGLLRPKLEAIIAARTAAREAAAAQGRDEAELANAAFEAERLAHFVGREGPLAALDAYLAAPAAVPLVVAGPGGSGKSTLLARVVEDVRAALPGALVLARYVGVTPGAESVRTLLDGLRAELAAAYEQRSEPVREDFERARAFREALAWATADRPLILFVDALDQFGPAPVPLDWLPEALPPHVHLVVSLLDEADRPELATLQAHQPAPQLVKLDRMDAAEGDRLLTRWLTEAGRALQPAQRAAVLAAFAPEGRPLHLRLAFEEARRWRSFDDAAALPPLDPTIPGLVAARFRRLEQRKERGPLFTGHTLGLLRAAKNGLAEDELLSLLSRDAAVRWDLRRSSPSSPPIDPELPLPAALWARLHADLGPYLTEREADGARLLTYYHRQLVDVAAGRYLRGAKWRARHRELARYFEAQPLLEGDRPNLRKLSEQPTQEAAGGLTAALHHTLTDVGFLERKIAHQRTAGALADLALAPPSDEALRDIAAALRLGAHALDEVPEETASQLRGRLPAAVWARLHGALPPTSARLQLDTPSLTLVNGPLRRILAGHTNMVRACAFSPDGRLALSASHDHTLRLWDVASGHTVHALKGHTDIVNACAFSLDGRLALSASQDHTLRLWDVASGQTRHILAGHTDTVTACTFSPGLHLVLSASWDGTLRLWDVASGQALHTLTGHNFPVLACAFSTDGRLALSASWDHTLQLWDMDTYDPVHPLEGHTDQVVACAFSPDSRLALSASRDHTLRLWAVASGQTVYRLAGHTRAVRACAFSPDGRLALSASHDATLRLWEVASGQTVHTLAGHTSGVNACAFSPDGMLLLSASDDDTLRLWDVDSGELVHTLAGHSHDVHAGTFSPDGGTVLSASDDNTLRVWDVSGAESVLPPEGHANQVQACAFSPDGRLALSASLDHTVRLWAVGTGQTVHVLRGHANMVNACAFSPDGRLALSASHDATLRLWEVASGREVQVLRGHTSEVNACTFSPDGRLALSASQDTTLRLWDVVNGELVHTLIGHTNRVQACAFSPDGRTALSASQDHTLRLWDVTTGQAVHTLAGHMGVVQACAFSPDGCTALSASFDHTLRLWDVATGQMMHTLEGHTDAVFACAFNTEGTLALSAAGDFLSDDHTLRLWGVASGQTVHMLTGHTRDLHACAFSLDGRMVLSASADQTLRLWSVASGREVARFDADFPLHCCAVSPDGRHAMTGDERGTVHFLTVVGMEDMGAAGSPPSSTAPRPVTLAALQPGAAGERAPTDGPEPPDGHGAQAQSVRRWWPFGRRG